MTPRERFLSLLKHDILKLDLAKLNFGVYRILNARRDLVLRFLDETQTLAYRVEVDAANQVTMKLLKLARKHVGGLLTEDQFRALEAQVARIVGLNDLAERIEALLQKGQHAMPDDDLERPLPRLWCEEDLYRPLLKRGKKQALAFVEQDVQTIWDDLRTALIAV